MNLRIDDLHHRWLETPSEPVIVDEIPDPEPPPHPQPTDPPPTAVAEGGSGTAGPETREKDQAGSFARDAEQDPAAERHGRSDAER